MSQKIAMNRPTPVTLAATILQIVPLTTDYQAGGVPTTLAVYECTGDVRVVTEAGLADGGAAPTAYGVAALSGSQGEMDITGRKFLGVCSSGAATCMIELR